MFEMIVAFLQAGGNPNTPFILKFCKEWEIKHQEFADYMKSDRREEVLERLRNAGLI